MASLSEVVMNVTEFFSSLLGRDTSRELAVQLVEVYQARTGPRHDATAAAGWAGR